MMANSLSGCSRAARDFLGMSCVLERVVPHPEDFVCLSTGNSSDFAPQPWVAGNLHVHGSCELRGPKKKLTNNLYHKILLNLSCAIKYKKPDMRPVPVLSDYFSKASNTGFSRHIKIGCHLPVCITTFVGRVVKKNVWVCVFQKSYDTVFKRAPRSRVLFL